MTDTFRLCLNCEHAWPDDKGNACPACGEDEDIAPEALECAWCEKVLPIDQLDDLSCLCVPCAVEWSTPT